jgi:NDP-sugar pyrophosphorylase family protein
MADVAGRPFITYLLDQLADAGIAETILCTGYMADHVRNTLGDSYHGMKLGYSIETEPLGTGGALRLATPLLRTDKALVMNGDSCCLADLGAFANWSRANHAKAALLLTQVEDGRRFGRIHTDEVGHILSFLEKTDEPGATWINSGIYLIETNLLETIAADRPVSLERDVFPSWIGKGFFGYKVLAPFLDIGTPESYARGETFLRNFVRAGRHGLSRAMTA